MTDLRRRQQVAAANLAHWLTHPLPSMEWELSSHPGEPALLGQPPTDYTPEQEADAVRQWAAGLGLPAPTWERSPDGVGGMYESSGVTASVTVRVRTFLEHPPGSER